jgi:hypothetical protein
MREKWHSHIHKSSFSIFEVAKQEKSKSQVRSSLYKRQLEAAVVKWQQVL